jgi:glucose-6-phosphate 1-dehydrogenase
MTTPEQVIIFGASGDLTRRKLIPALARLDADSGAPSGFSVLGVSRTPMTDAEFRAHLAQDMSPDLRAAFDPLADRIFYHAADTSDLAALEGLGGRLDALPGGKRAGRLFYLSLKPELFPVVVDRLGKTGLLKAWEEEEGFRRVVVEKPFGFDLESARKLNRDLHQTLQEEQIYRIDHYLGKETVQNLLGFRFHNAIFEPLWNRHHVDFVEITIAETLGVENGRGAYYDDTGALRDMVQNHMLQVLALIAMEPPATLDADAVRTQKVELLRALQHPQERPGQTSLVRARYVRGADGASSVCGYLEEEGVAKGSDTETYVALRAKIENWRWSGVPFFLRHGKRMRERYTEVKVQFHTPPLQLFNRASESDAAASKASGSNDRGNRLGPNLLTLRIQPEEKICLSFGVKRPGNTMDMEPAQLDFDYLEHFGESSPDAYERLLADALAGDQTLFLRGDEIEVSWEYADSVRKAWQQSQAAPIHEYPAGSWGPEEADALFADEEGEWSRGRDGSS